MNTPNLLLKRPWGGPSKIVVGIDIGTSDSGVSFVFLQQGAIPIICRVTHWPGQEAQTQRNGVPTLVWYNKDGEAVSFGAKALSQAEEDAEDNDWTLAKHFPLQLYPNRARVEYGLQLSPLPFAVSLQQIYSDFLRYLLQYTNSFFEDRVLDGRRVWTTYSPSMEVVITHPREWGPREQQFLRNAVVSAGFIDSAAASRQILFVTESEATIHLAQHHTNISRLFQPAKNLVVCDIGESAVKITRLSIVTAQPILKLKEHSSAYVQGGGSLVDAAAEGYLRNVLGSAGLGHEDISDYTSRGMHDFRDGKKSFLDAAVDWSIEIAGSRFNNQSIRTRRGRMSLSGATVRSFFDVLVNETCAALDHLLHTSTALDILLTGEFGEIPFLQKVLKERYEPKGCQLSVVDNSTSYGAVIWGISTRVIHRVPRYSYGFVVSTKFDPRMDEHRGRETFTSSKGYEEVIGAWSQVVTKGMPIAHDEVVRVPFHRTYPSLCADEETLRLDMFSYSGDGKPNFARDRQGNLLNGFTKVCTMTAELSDLTGALKEVTGAPGQSHWSLTFNLCIEFGGTELSVHIECQENGVTRTASVEIQPAEIV